MTIHNPFDKNAAAIELPDSTQIYSMRAPQKLPDAADEILKSLARPIGSVSLETLAKKKLADNENAKAVIVISDNTRPVPYKGKNGILMPLVNLLLDAGYKTKNLTVLIANGTHQPMTQTEIEKIIDAEIFKRGIPVVNHDCRDNSSMVHVGTTRRGSEVVINKTYMEADLKILTGLVESHFMAGCSGGRKSICPGLISEHGTYIFHSAELMGHPKSCDLNLDGNPVHEESLEFARMAGADFIVNVTLDHAFDITGVFSGDLEKAHLAALDKLRSYAKIKIREEADIVVTHDGFVGINHYQSAKAAFASIGALKKDGYLVTVGNFTDKKDIIGSVAYKTVLGILSLTGADSLIKVLHSKDWSFIPDQWQVQKWAAVFQKIPPDRYYYFAPQLDAKTCEGLPGINAGQFLNSKEPSISDFSAVISKSIEHIRQREKKDNLSILWLNDGPYAIPYV